VVAAVLASAGVCLPFLSFPAGASERTDAVAIPQKTWTWTGPAQHPYGIQHPDFQYVAEQNGAPQSRALVQLGQVSLAPGEDIASLVLTYPANTDPQNGAIDPYNNASVPTAQQQGNVAVLVACPIATPFVPDPPGNPDNPKVTVDCELGSAAGRVDTSGAEPAWVFDLTTIAAGWLSGAYAENGVAIVPSKATGGTWTVALDGTKAKAEARITSVDAPPPAAVTLTPSTGPSADSGSSSGSVPVPSISSSEPGIPLTPISNGLSDATTASPTAVPSASPAPAAPAVRPVVQTTAPTRRVPAPVWVGLLLLAAVLGVSGQDLWQR
jgi:hypothetical protein